MPFYFPTLDQRGGMEKKVYEARSLFIAYAQFELACEPAHIWGTRAIASRKERKSKAIRRSGVW